MKSNVCTIENGTRDLAEILKESQKVAVYNNLDRKQTLQLQLLCEEIDGMLPRLLGDFSGDLWIDFEKGVCKVCVSIEFARFTMNKKENLIAVSSDGKNTSALGIAGKIRSFMEDIFLDAEARETYSRNAGAFGPVFGSVDYSAIWSLEKYKEYVKAGEQEEAWDELEKSIIASLADDVLVGVKGRHADIVLVKSFI